jgi:hypothetical protein
MPGKQALGDWPRFDLFVDPETLASILDRLADLAPNAEEAESRRSAAGLIRRLGRSGGREFVTGAASTGLRLAMQFLLS